MTIRDRCGNHAALRLDDPVPATGRQLHAGRNSSSSCCCRILRRSRDVPSRVARASELVGAGPGAPIAAALRLTLAGDGFGAIPRGVAGSCNCSLSFLRSVSGATRRRAVPEAEWRTAMRAAIRRLLRTRSWASSLTLPWSVRSSCSVRSARWKHVPDVAHHHRALSASRRKPQSSSSFSEMGEEVQAARPSSAGRRLWLVTSSPRRSIDAGLEPLIADDEHAPAPG